jgi:hypothetical protein
VLLVFDLTVVDRETFPLELVVDGVKPLEKAKRVAPNARALVSLPGQPGVAMPIGRRTRQEICAGGSNASSSAWVKLKKRRHQRGSTAAINPL